MMKAEAMKDFIADLARPFSIIATSGSAAYATGVIAWSGKDFSGAAFFIAAVYAGLGALYWGKAWERAAEAKQTATVEKERAKASPPPAEALKPADSEPEVEVDPAMYGGPRG